MSVRGGLPYGLVQYGGAQSPFERIYAQLTSQITDPRTGRSPFDLSQGTWQEGKLWAWSVVLAGMLCTVYRAAAQGEAWSANEGLPNLEADFGIIPPYGASIGERRAALAAAQAATQGASYESVVAAMKALLGSNFVSFFSAADLYSASSPATIGALAVPSNPSTSAQTAAKILSVPPKYFSLQDAIAPVNAMQARWVAYTDLDPLNTSAPLVVGDVVMVQPNDSLVSEKVTVLNVATNTGPLTGTVWALGGGVVLHGIGTKFTQEVKKGDPLYIVDDGGVGTMFQVSGVPHDNGLSITTSFGNNVTNKVARRGPPSDTIGQRRFRAIFSNAHDAGAILTTMNWPWVTSPIRSLFVVLANAVASDSKTRSMTMDLLRRTSRACDSYSVLRADANTVPFTLGTTPLGTSALTTVTYTPST